MDVKNKFDIADLQAFDAVAKLGAFSKAADSLHLSQPALSRRIDKLESALGFAAWHYLPPILAKFYEAYPRIKVKVMDGSANEVLTDVAKGHADLGINFMGAQESDLEFETLLDERFVLACRRDHPLAAKTSVAWRELKNYHLIGLAKSSGNRLVLDLALAKVAERPHIFYEAQHVQAQLGMVEAGIGAAAVPASALHQNLTTPLVGVPLTSPIVERKLGLITRRARVLSPAALLFKSILLPS